jgi:hypothetical protein
MKRIRQPREYALAIVGLLTCLFFTSSSFAQCSTSAWTSVAGSAQSIGTSTNPTGKKYEGICGLTVNASSAPAHYLESAILATLQPGAYTAWLQAADTSLGIGLVEVLDLSGGSISSY